MTLRNDGQPTSPGFYWVLRRGTKFVEQGRPEVVEIKMKDGELWADGFGEDTLEEIGFAWQRVKQFDEQ